MAKDIKMYRGDEVVIVNFLNVELYESLGFSKDPPASQPQTEENKPKKDKPTTKNKDKD